MAAGLKRFVKSDWSAAVLVCTKCSKRLDGGFGKKGKQSLAKALRGHLGGGKNRKARVGVVEVKCLGVCPRGAVTTVNASQPDRWRLVHPGDDLDVVAGDLGLTAPPQ